MVCVLISNFGGFFLFFIYIDVSPYPYFVRNGVSAYRRIAYRYPYPRIRATYSHVSDGRSSPSVPVLPCARHVMLERLMMLPAWLGTWLGNKVAGRVSHGTRCPTDPLWVGSADLFPSVDCVVSHGCATQTLAVAVESDISSEAADFQCVLLGLWCWLITEDWSSGNGSNGAGFQLRPVHV